MNRQANNFTFPPAWLQSAVAAPPASLPTAGPYDWPDVTGPVFGSLAGYDPNKRSTKQQVSHLTFPPSWLQPTLSMPSAASGSPTWPEVDGLLLDALDGEDPHGDDAGLVDAVVSIPAMSTLDELAGGVHRGLSAAWAQLPGGLQKKLRSIKEERDYAFESDLEMIQNISKAAWDAVTLAGDAGAGRIRRDDPDYIKRVVNLAGFLTTGGFGRAPSGSLGTSGARPSLLKDSASRFARSKTMDYSEQTYWRADKGRSPVRYPGGEFFTPNRRKAEAMAKRFGTEARPFRLNLTKAFHDKADLTVRDYVRFVEAAEKQSPALARDLVNRYFPGYDKKSIVALARERPNDVVTRGIDFRRYLQDGDKGSIKLFIDAGYDAIHYGRDVRKLKGSGIRHEKAMFDPDKSLSDNIFASLLALIGGDAAVRALQEEKEAAPDSSQDRQWY